MGILFSLITFCLLLVGAVLLFGFGLAAGVVGFVGKLVFGVAGFGLRLTAKTILFGIAVLLLLIWIF